jgi:hypothetical protein
MSVWYNTLKAKYEEGSVSKAGLAKAVKLRWITSAEYAEITGEALK